MIVLCANPACQQPFTVKPSHLKRIKRQHCSQACRNACFVPRTLEERFWSKVDTTSTPEGCWLWTGSYNKNLGYGLLNLPEGHNHRRKQFLAHRIGYIVQYGPIPEGLLVLHKPPCVNRLCVRHLYLGTHQDNAQDMVALGRSTKGISLPVDRRAYGNRNGSVTHPERVPRGEQHSHAKLTDHDVATIRAAYTGVRGEQAALANQYHVSHSLISVIVNNKRRP